MTHDLGQMEDPLGLLRLGYGAPLLQVAATQWHDGQVEARTESVVEETPVALVYNGLPHVVMMATPADLEDFVLGFSFTEGLIRSAADLKTIEVIRYSQGVELQITTSPECEAVIAGRTRRLVGRTGCGICGTDSIAAVLREVRAVSTGRRTAPGVIHAAFASLARQQRLNAAAGALHAAGWASGNGDVEFVREDVGRHNALDKLIGALLKRGSDPNDGFIAITSRASFEMVQKGMAFGAPMVAAISGPTGLAVRLAHQAGMTLVGFARADRLTVYTHPERIGE